MDNLSIQNLKLCEIWGYKLSYMRLSITKVIHNRNVKLDMDQQKERKKFFYFYKILFGIQDIGKKGDIGLHVREKVV